MNTSTDNKMNNNCVNFQLIKQLVVRATKQQVDGIVKMVQEWSREGQVPSSTSIFTRFSVMLICRFFGSRLLCTSCALLSMQSVSA